MNPITVSQVTIGPLDEANLVTKQLTDSPKIDYDTGCISSSRDNKDLHKLLFARILTVTMMILSTDPHDADVGDIQPLFDLLFFMLESTDHNDRCLLKKKLYLQVIEKMSLLNPYLPRQQYLMTKCLYFLNRLIAPEAIGIMEHPQKETNDTADHRRQTVGRRYVSVSSMQTIKAF